MKLLLAVVYVFSWSIANGQLPWCTNLPPFSLIENDFEAVVNSSGQAGSTFSLIELYYNCIVYGSSDGSLFREATITVRYEIDGTVASGQTVFQCADFGGTFQWVSDPEMIELNNGLLVNGTTTRCRSCRELSDSTCDACTEDCTNGVLNYDCSGCMCNDGYTGTDCQTDIDECLMSPPVCEGGGTCTNTPGNFNCTCPDPCIGDCNACCSSPCTRGGTCRRNGTDDFICDCPTGFSGKRCQDFEGGCHSNPCMNDGVCRTVGSSVTEYQCSCPVGFTGRNCEIQIDYCVDQPCGHEGWCINSQTGRTCICLDGFTGSDCGQPLLTCRSNTLACGANGQCVHKVVGTATVSYCSCYPGYTGELCNVAVDSCVNDMDPCSHRSQCIPANGFNTSFACNCFGNWTGFYCTECSLQCGELGQSDGQCTSCTCNAPNTDRMCNMVVADPGGSSDSSDVGLIVGCVVGGLLALAFAGILLFIAICFMVKSSSKSKRIEPKLQKTEDPFYNAKPTTMPMFSGSIYKGSSSFKRMTPSSQPDVAPSEDENTKHNIKLLS